MITIVHGGQTGVDRGAHEAALDVGTSWKVTGFMPADGRDEQGLIPRQVAAFLQPCRHKGYAARTAANLQIAHALLVVVYDAQDPYATPGTKLTLTEARKIALPRVVVDPSTDTPTLARWLQELVNRHVQRSPDPFRLMVAGPRASKWPQGQTETAGLLRRIHIHLQEKQP